jgi:hypothetical protein
MTVYASTMPAVETELRGAQLAVTVHALDLAGRCVRCDEPGPCRYRLDAVRRFALFQRLPARVPGATRPECVGEGSPWKGWLVETPRRVES